MKTTFYILISLFLTSCFSSVEPKIQADYIEAKNSFDSLLTINFPKILPNEYIGYGFSMGESDKYSMSKYLYIKLRYSFKKKYNLEKEKLIKRSKYNVNSTDTCSIKVFAEHIWDKRDLIDTLKNLNIACATGYPIPSFESNTYNDTSYRKYNEVYVIDSDTTLFITNPNRPKIQYLPDEWTKGYSLGFTTNDKYLLIDYWIVVW